MAYISFFILFQYFFKHPSSGCVVSYCFGVFLKFGIYDLYVYQSHLIVSETDIYHERAGRRSGRAGTKYAIERG